MIVTIVILICFLQFVFVSYILLIYYKKRNHPCTVDCHFCIHENHIMYYISCAPCCFSLISIEWFVLNAMRRFNTMKSYLFNQD